MKLHLFNMQSTTIYFSHNARRVFTAAKWAVQRAGIFSHIEADERLFRIKASHGLPIVGENIELRIVATGTCEASVEITSSDKLLYNIFKWGNNKSNVKELAALVQNEIYRYLQTYEEPRSRAHSEIRIVPPEIKIIK